MIWNELKSLELFLTLIWNANRAPTAVKINEWATPDCLSFHWNDFTLREHMCQTNYSPALQMMLEGEGFCCWRVRFVDPNFFVGSLRITSHELPTERSFFLWKKTYLNCVKYCCTKNTDHCGSIFLWVLCSSFESSWTGHSAFLKVRAICLCYL